MASVRRASVADTVVRLLMVVLLCLCITCDGHYLNVSSRWLVKEADGQRIKLACVNWAGHLETMLPEGLNRQPLNRLAYHVNGMGFNCVRLTFATYMLTNATIYNRTVAQIFMDAKLEHTLRGIVIHNPELINLPIQDAYACVVQQLTHAGLLIILDNHVSKPQWCCANNDGNGFWGDMFFDTNAWVQGLCLVASMFKDNDQVVGISLRNELRGPKQNINDWYKYMALGANAVHKVNPNTLIILSGLHFDTDLRFLASNHLKNLSFQDKLVYEMHWYTSSYGVNFAKGNLNKACAIATSSVMKGGASMVIPTTNRSFTSPIIISEFGIDQRGGNKANNNFITCFFAFMASMDLDWAYWPLQGDYYIRHGNEGDEEYYGILNSRWNEPRNTNLLSRLQAIQQPWKSGDNNSSSKSQYMVMFHPATGMCVKNDNGNSIILGSCKGVIAYWKHTQEGRLVIENMELCVSANGEEKFVELKPIGYENNGPWSLASVAKLQFSTTMRYEQKKYDRSVEVDSMEPHGGTDLIVSKEEYTNKVHISEKYNIDDTKEDENKDKSENHKESNEERDKYDYSWMDLKEELTRRQPVPHHNHLCLDGSKAPFIITRKCICVEEDEDCGEDDDPSQQWFILISNNPRSSEVKHPSTL